MIKMIDKEAKKALKEYEKSLKGMGIKAKDKEGKYKSFNNIDKEIEEINEKQIEDFCNMFLDMISDSLKANESQCAFKTNTWTAKDFKKEVETQVERELGQAKIDEEKTI